VAFISRPKVAGAMKAYRAIGTFRKGRNKQEFTIDIVAEDEGDAEHRILSNFGSRHGAPRRNIDIISLEEINPSESNAPIVVSHFRDN